MLDFLTDDVELQQKIKELINNGGTSELKYNFAERIFSVKNQTKNNKRYKIVTILGIKIKLKKFEKSRIVRIMGGLGNQMFQYAFGRALEHATGQKVIYDTSWFEEAKKTIVNEKNENAQGVVMRKYDLDIFNLNIEIANYNQSKNCKKKIYETKEYQFDKTLLKKQKSAIYEGYFQNEGYYKDIKEILKKDFTFPEISQEDEFNQNWLKKIRESDNPVFIHIRRGDYLNLAGWALSTDYYRKAINYINSHVSNPTFFVFGQECEDYIKKEFGSDNFEIIGEINTINKTDWKNISLMLECKHAIIANSSFSWWAAWLGKANEGVVIAPTPFVNGKDGIICDNWVKIER